MKAKKVAAGIVVLVLVIVSVLYGVVEYNYHGGMLLSILLIIGVLS